MRAVLRLTMAMFAAGLALGPSPAHAQSPAQPATNTPATDTIGPRELQGFNLNGTVTRPAETPPAPARRPAREPSAPSAASPSTASTTASSRRATAPPPAPARTAPPPANPGQSLALDLPATGAAPTVSPSALQTQPLPTDETSPAALPAD